MQETSQRSTMEGECRWCQVTSARMCCSNVKVNKIKKKNKVKFPTDLSLPTRKLALWSIVATRVMHFTMLDPFILSIPFFLSPSTSGYLPYPYYLFPLPFSPSIHASLSSRTVHHFSQLPIKQISFCGRGRMCTDVSVTWNECTCLFTFSHHSQIPVYIYRYF